MAFTCSNCGNEFTRKDSLVRHQTRCNIPKVDMSPITSITPIQGHNITLYHPFTATIAGPSFCGKTTLTGQIIKHSNTLISPAPVKIVYFYKIWQKAYERMENVDFKQQLPDINTLCSDPHIPRLFIIDDMMDSATQSREMCSIFTEASHHYNFSLIFIVQNLFYGGKMTRTMSLNTSYIVVCKSPRDRSQIATLARQMYPNNSRKLIDAYEQATSEPFGYLLIDLKQETPEDRRLIKRINFNNQPITVPPSTSEWKAVLSDTHKPEDKPVDIMPMSSNVMSSNLSTMCAMTLKQFKAFLPYCSKQDVTLLKQLVTDFLNNEIPCDSETIDELEYHQHFLVTFSNYGASKDILVQKANPLYTIVQLYSHKSNLS